MNDLEHYLRRQAETKAARQQLEAAAAALELALLRERAAAYYMAIGLMRNGAETKGEAMSKLTKLQIEVVGKNGIVCMRLLKRLCDMILDSDLTAPIYTVGEINGNATCEVTEIEGGPEE
jgi:hypothetical protein